MTTYIQNRKAKHDYEILDTYEAGLVLHGFEAKSIRTGKASLNGTYVIIRGGEAFLVNANITAYQPANTPKDYDPERVRKLLLNQKELAHLERSLHTQGLTIVPLSLYNSGRNIKLKIALVRGKKKADKRETIKQRDVKRDIQRTLKG
ncbi:SsrA-binding protein SmpB [Candidatus Kaiserbacteria bacterium]|nr:SsrA-binding protein SmpB [Candidatus Kaiserbacteria bacterium]